AEVNPRAGAGRELAVTGNEVGMQVGLDDMADRQALRRRFLQVLIDVAPRVHDRRLALRPDDVGRLSETAEVELLEVHRSRDSTGLRLYSSISTAKSGSSWRRR